MNSKPSANIPVWDPVVRLSHWTLATAFLVAMLTEDEWSSVHVSAGYLIGGLLVLRVSWGFLGPTHARFSDFVRTPREVMAYAAAAIRWRAPRYIGHNPAGGAMVVALMTSLTVTVVSGIALYGATDFAGPLAGVFRGELAAALLEGLHELGANLTLLLVFLHLGGVLFSSLAHEENLIESMITGRKKEIRP